MNATNIGRSLTTPSLLPSRAAEENTVARVGEAGSTRTSLLDLMSDGFYMLFLLRNRYAPASTAPFKQRVQAFLATFERQAKALDHSTQDIYLSKYAFCALVDECILHSQFRVREDWELQPLQLELFGDQLAGEHFFDRLEEARREGKPRIAVLEIFHMCLLVGFRGRYVLEGSEKLAYLTARLGDEIAHLKGARPAFAPHWAAPDTVAHRLRYETPLWALLSLVALASTLAFAGMRWSLGHDVKQAMDSHAGMINLPQRAAHFTISLP